MSNQQIAAILRAWIEAHEDCQACADSVGCDTGSAVEHAMLQLDPEAYDRPWPGSPAPAEGASRCLDCEEMGLRICPHQKERP